MLDIFKREINSAPFWLCLVSSGAVWGRPGQRRGAVSSRGGGGFDGQGGKRRNHQVWLDQRSPGQCYLHEAKDAKWNNESYLSQFLLVLGALHAEHLGSDALHQNVLDCWTGWNWWVWIFFRERTSPDNLTEVYRAV